MANNACLVNGRAYSYVDINVNILGRTLEGISAISYNQSQDKQDNGGRGQYNVSRGYGNKQANASITIDLKEYQALVNALPPGKDITDINWFPIIVTFENDDNILVVHRLEKVEFMDQSMNPRTGDTRTEVEIPLIVGKINFKGV